MRNKLEIDKKGNKYYLNKHGLPHRKNGPAIENTDGSKLWYLNGILHREDGPAIECVSGYQEYWYKGICVKAKCNEHFKKLIELDISILEVI